TSCSSRVRNDPRSRFESRMSISRSVNFAPSIRVEAPTDSTVATRRSVAKRSGARFPNAFQAPLNSSISPTSRKRSEVSARLFNGSSRISANIPVNTQFGNRVFAGIFVGRLNQATPFGQLIESGLYAISAWARTVVSQAEGGIRTRGAPTGSLDDQRCFGTPSGGISEVGARSNSA